jgi:cell division protein FtsL
MDESANLAGSWHLLTILNNNVTSLICLFLVYLTTLSTVQTTQHQETLLFSELTQRKMEGLGYYEVRDMK